ncbi:biotin--[acetyl-CoA-carboxylase] ligase [Ignisphaera sp. 4213-co]|uniref:Biotin--[acetyl-CoA-carboxylase] ligase n=1 Tax=Ignisphaera cupida TaxID=3050454 RepID=A0ABD4Z849_9CREN|nr:biotin--[acetyl-CoA-carboxylase] ligase [Ignisphaera sp. 4213-co]MDK6029414.1 biotin--[acetyl-CoA-carboxylase] ligase [Ignisphaera sp. 4213-co]
MDVCDSTQDVAFALALSGASEGVVVVAEELRLGRGRMGRRWVASRGGLWMSIVLRPESFRNMQLLSLASAVAVAKAIRNLLSVDARVKWPNDVLVNDKKVAGILVEGYAKTSYNFVVLGIGVNVNNDLPPDLQNTATTLKSVVGAEVSRKSLLLKILENIDEVYAKLKQGMASDILNEWRKYSSTLGRMVRVVTRDGVLEGFAEDIEDDGALRIRTREGEAIRVYEGDIIHLRT